MRTFHFALLVAALSASGCLGSLEEAAQVETATGAPRPTHVLVGAREPEGLVAPTFRLVGPLAVAAPAYGAGEPAVWAALDGSLVAAFPGCDRDALPTIFSDMSACPVGVVYRSEDGGGTWTRLNGDDGQLAQGAQEANGDADVAVDAAGVIYVSNLGDGIPVQKSEDDGATWVDLGNPVPEDSRGVDRNWMAAAGPGHVVLAWMGGPQDETRQVGITATRDGGATWSEPAYVGDEIGWLGSPQFAPDGRTVFVPFTQPEGRRAVGDWGLGAGAQDYRLLVARSTDGGAAWTVLDTGTTLTRAAVSFHFSGMLMAPTLDVTGEGTLVYAWSEEVRDPAGATSIGAVVKLIASRDGGATWGAPVVVSARHSAIMPWVTGGAGDRVAITYLASDVPGDTDRVGLWDVMATVVDGVGGPEPLLAHAIIDRGVHEGGACTQGGACFLTASDRALLDYFESDVLPDGRLVVVYPADPAAGGKRIEIRAAIQDGGTPLLAPGARGEKP